MDREDPPPDEPKEDREIVELVRRALRGDKAARKLLCERQLPLFQQVAARLTHRFRNVTPETARQEAMDILHHIVCAFLTELQEEDGVVARWRPERGPLSVWLRPFATCRGLDYLRKRKSGRYLSMEDMKGAIESGLLELCETSPHALQRIEYHEALQKLCELIGNDPTLGKDSLQLLERLFWDEEDRELVARSLGLRRNTLDARVKRLRDALLGLGAQLGLPFGQRATGRGTKST